MNNLRATFPAGFLVWFILLSGACSAAEMIASWRMVVDELSLTGKVLRSPFEDHWTNSATLRELVAERRTDAILELAAQPQAGLAKFAAYFALRKIDLKSAQELGLEIALTTSVIENPFVATVTGAIVKDLPNSSFGGALTKTLRSSPIYSLNAGFLIQQIPDGMLREWFEDRNRPSLPVTYEALVVERLYLDAGRRREELPQKTKELIEQYALFPGVPRMIFLSFVDEKHPLFKRVLSLCLEDETLPDDLYVPFLYAQANPIGRHIEVQKLNIPEKRRAVIMDVLAKAKQLNRPPK